MLENFVFHTLKEIKTPLTGTPLKPKYNHSSNAVYESANKKSTKEKVLRKLLQEQISVNTLLLSMFSG